MTTSGNTYAGTFHYRPLLTLLTAGAISLLATVTPILGQPVTVRVVADDYYAVYTGTASSAVIRHFLDNWPNVATPPAFTPAGPYFYVVAWDKDVGLQGFLGSVASGSGFVTTGSALWSVCATNQALVNNVSAVPTAAALTPHIVACNTSGGWQGPVVGPNNGNAASNQIPSGLNLWNPVAAIDLTAAWIWNTDTSALCAGTNGFLSGHCNPGEFLIFRIQLDDIRGCAAPVPDFFIDWSAGYGVLIANGSNSQNELNYFWSIQESDQWWNRFGPEVTSWFSGQAAVFDLKAFYENATGTRLKCDTYYRIKLAVANNCATWRDTSQLIKLNCCPGANTQASSVTARP